MDREKISNDVLDICKKYTNTLLLLPTGTGKTKVALDILKTYKKKIKVLIVVPRNVLKEEWKREIDKWIDNTSFFSLNFSTYISIHKYAKETWDVVIFDEAHHLSIRCLDILKSFKIKRNILLSATVNTNKRIQLKEVFKDLYIYSIKMREAIDNNILPDPKVYLIPLDLNNSVKSETIIVNPKGKGRVIKCKYAVRWNYIKQKYNPIHIECTELEYINNLNADIEWFKKKFRQTNNIFLKNKWLHLCNKRLKWLSSKKNNYIKKILLYLHKERTLTFCSTVEQTELLGKSCINSKNKLASKVLEDFNNNKIQHITACDMLNEGANLVNCRIGVYANLNSSTIIIKQRLGRILRHKEPIIILPFYKNTREEEIINSMLEDYNKDLIETITDIKQIKL